MKTLYKYILAAVIAIPISITTSIQSAQAQRISIETYNRPNEFIRHRNSLGFITPVRTVLDRNDATFYRWRGLNGNSNCVSFESVNYRGRYLRHSGFRIRLDAFVNSQLFKNDATFCERPSLIRAAGFVSFESANFPGRYIRHRGGELYLDPRIPESLYERDASFRFVNPWSP
jgi:hypothetical protein